MLSAASAVSRAGVRSFFTASSRRLGGHGGEVSIAKTPKVAGVPMAADKFIKLTFVDLDNNRFEVQGHLGETLLETAKRSKIYLQHTCGGKMPHATTWDTGLQCYQCHVQVGNEYVDIVNKQNEISNSEKHQLSECDHHLKNVTQNSRLCCQVTLTPELDGMRVFIPTWPVQDAV